MYLSIVNFSIFDCKLLYYILFRLPINKRLPHWIVLSTKMFMLFTIYRCRLVTMLAYLHLWNNCRVPIHYLYQVSLSSLMLTNKAYYLGKTQYMAELFKWILARDRRFQYLNLIEQYSPIASHSESQQCSFSLAAFENSIL